MTVFWTAWLLMIAVSFALAEGYALRTDRKTLSRYVWDLSKAFPPFPWIVGVAVGFLACHFWWGGSVCFGG